jgi:hypothetical protein
MANRRLGIHYARTEPPESSRAPTSSLTGAPVIAVGNRAVPAGAANTSGAGVAPAVDERATVGAEATRPSAGTVGAGAAGVAVRGDNDAAATAATTGAAAATTPGAEGAVQI